MNALETDTKRQTEIRNAFLNSHAPQEIVEKFKAFSLHELHLGAQAVLERSGLTTQDQTFIERESHIIRHFLRELSLTNSPMAQRLFAECFPNEVETE